MVIVSRDEETVEHLLDVHVVHVLLDAWRWLSHLRGKVEETRPVVTETAQLTRSDAGVWPQNALDGRRFEQTLQHATRAPVLQTLVRGEAVLGAVATVTELAHVQRVGLFVLVLEVALQRVVAGEGAMAVRTLLGFVDASAGGRGHPQLLLLALSRGIGVTFGVAVDLLDHVVAVAVGTQEHVVVVVVVPIPIRAAIRRLLGTGGHGRGSCGRVHAVQSCGEGGEDINRQGN